MVFLRIWMLQGFFGSIQVPRNRLKISSRADLVFITSFHS